MFIFTAPFKFDVPSPDDMVSSGIKSSLIGSKGILFRVSDCLLILLTLDFTVLHYLLLNHGMPSYVPVLESYSTSILCIVLQLRKRLFYCSIKRNFSWLKLPSI